MRHRPAALLAVLPVLSACARRGPPRGDCTRASQALHALTMAFPRLAPGFDAARRAAWTEHGGAYEIDWHRDPRSFPRTDAAGQALVQRFHPDGTIELALSDRPAFQIALRPVEAASGTTTIVNGIPARAGTFADTDLFAMPQPTCGSAYLHVRSARAPRHFEFEVTLGGEVGEARVIKAGSVELVELHDRAGIARLRVFRPVLTDSDREKRPGHIDLRGSRLVLSIDPTGLRLPAAAMASWQMTANMGSARYGLGVSPLPDGRVLTTGGCSGTSCRDALAFPHCPAGVTRAAEIYDPPTGTWSYTPEPMNAPRFAHTESVLLDGRVLLAGGCGQGDCGTPLDTTEIYEPEIRRFVVGPKMSSRRAHHTATTLPDGRVLLVGGCGFDACVAAAEIFDPVMTTFSAAGTLAVPRGRHAAALLRDGRVLVAGGYSPGQALASTEIWASKVFSPGPSQRVPRGGAAAIGLPDGTVWIAGGCRTPGCTDITDSSEIVDPERGTSDLGPTLAVRRAYHALLPLPGDRFLVTAGFSGPRDTLTASAEIYEPASRSLSPAGKLITSRALHGMALLGNGRVLTTGGCDLATCLWHSETFDPTSAPPVDGGVPPDDGGGEGGGGDHGGHGGHGGGSDPPDTCLDGAKPFAPSCSTTPRHGERGAVGALTLLGVILALRRRASTLLVAVLTCGLGCNASGRPTSVRERVVVGWSALRISVPVVVAATEGVFARHGLDVMLDRYDTAQPMADDLSAGRLDAAGYVAYPILVEAMAARGARPWAVTEIVEDDEHPLSFLVRRKGTDIRGLSDLRGQSVGILPTLAYRRWLEAALAKAGVEPPAVRIRPIPPALEPTSLASGAIDALFTGDPPATGAIVSGAGEPVAIRPLVPSTFGTPFPFGTFALSDQLVRERPAAAAALTRALDEAIRIARADPDSARRALAAHLPDSQRLLVPHFSTPRYHTSFEVDPDTLAAHLDRQQQAGVTTQGVPIRVFQPAR